MELVVEVIGAIVRAIFEVALGRIADFVGSIYDRIYQTVRWNSELRFPRDAGHDAGDACARRGNFLRNRQSNPVDDRLMRYSGGSSGYCSAAGGMTVPGSLRAVQMWMAFERSTGSSSEPALMLR